MSNILENWNGTITLNNEVVDNNVNLGISSPIHLVLMSNGGILAEKEPKEEHIATENKVTTLSEDYEYKVTVKPYMTQPATPEFDFMEKWNNNIPMPMRVMEGIVLKETKGMVYMDLRGMCAPTITCYCCGKELTNPISRRYGVGPVCLSKLGITRNIEDVDDISGDLISISWKGWIIKSAITSIERY